MLKHRTLLLFVSINILFCFSCSTQDSKDNIIFNFAEGLDGWSTGVSGKQLDGVSWISWDGRPPGCVKLDGSDFGTSDHMANSWIYKEIEIPSSAKNLSFLTSAHNREGANGELRVVLYDENQMMHILIDWELANNGIEDELDWISKSVSIETWAGQTIMLFFEQGDNDVGNGEQRYIDKIEIK